MRARTHLRRLHRDLYERLSHHPSHTLEASADLQRYFRDYQSDFRDFRSLSSKKELLEAIQEAHLTICGDYHTLAQAQKTVIRLLRETQSGLMRKKRPLLLALEMLRVGDNTKVARFLQGQLSEASLLKAIGFHKHWGFSWENYRRIFLFAKEFGIPIVGISADAPLGSLAARDKFAARELVSLTATSRDTLIFVLIGDLHLASTHLPLALDQELQKRHLDRKTIIVLQNHDRFYWKLAERGLEHRIDVVKVDERVFCVLNTPPWVKLQSQIRWADIVAEGRLKPVDQKLDPLELISDLDPVDEVRELLEMLQRFLGVRIPIPDDFSVATPGSMGFLDRLAPDKRFSRRERLWIRYSTKRLESAFIPGLKVLYLASLSLNHVAQQATHLLHHRMSGFQRLFLRPRDDFYTFVWVEALGFFGSRVINPRRKCNGPKDWARLAVKEKTVTERNRAREALQHLRREWLGKRPAPPPASSSLERLFFYYQVAQQLGHLLGHALYSAVLHGDARREEIRTLFENDFKPLVARQLYFDWTRRLDAKKYRKFEKTERL